MKKKILICHYGIIFNINGKYYTNSNMISYLKSISKNYSITLAAPLNKVNINYSKKDSLYTCLAPSYRSHDIERDVDIYEEIARVIGFNNIKNIRIYGLEI